MINILKHFGIERDKHSHNNRVCPNCNSTDVMVIGHNKLRGEDTYHCTKCKNKFKVDV